MSTIKVKDADSVDRYYKNIGQGTIGDPFHAIPSDFYLEVAKGNVLKHKSINIFGNNSDIDTATAPEDIWSAGGTWTAPTMARTHNIKSTNSNDTGVGSGTGARTVEIKGLDASYNEISETINLNGTTNVLTANSYTRINVMTVLTFGSTGRNQGVITATATADLTITNQISALKGRSLSAIYTVPNGKTAYILKGFASMDRPNGTNEDMAVIVVYYRRNADQSDKGWIVGWEGSLSAEGSSFVDINYKSIPIFLEKTDIRISCDEVTENDTKISAGLDIILVDN